MKAEAYRELKVLEELSTNPSVTQRHLANNLQVALGLTNLMIRRLVKKGFIKVVTTSRNRIRYLLTPTGISEKSRLTYEYMEYSLHLYRELRQVLTASLTPLARANTRRIVFFGAGEMAEIASLTLQELGLELVGVVDDGLAGQRFLGLTVMRWDQIMSLAFDRGIVSTLDGGPEAIQARLSSAGIASDKVVFIEHRGPRIRLLAEAAA